MNRKTLLLAIAALTLAPALSGTALAQSGGPLGSTGEGYAVQAAQSFSRPARPEANERWREVAEHVARDVLQDLGAYQNVFVAPARSSSAFDREFRSLLIGELDALGMFVTNAPGPQVRVVQVQSTVSANYENGASFGKVVRRYVTEVVQGERQGGEVAMVSSADVMVAVRVQAGGVDLVRKSHSFNVATGDIHLYKKSPPVMRVVDQK